jgi:DNA polymerase-1
MTVTATATLASPTDVLRLLRWSRVVALDLETTGLDPRTARIRLLSISDGNQTVVMDCFEHDIRQVLPALRHKILVAHNAVFDLGFLWQAGLLELPDTICTYLLAQLLTAGETPNGFPRLNLGACCLRWLNRPVSKELQTSDWSGPLSADQLDYARKDAEVLLPLFRIQEQELGSAGLVEVSDIELRALPAFVWMAQSGVPFDRAGWSTLAGQAEAALDQAEAKLNDMAPHKSKADLFGEREKWNWASPKQVGDVLAALGCPAPSTNDYYLAECKHPIGEVLRTHRELSKRVGTYGREWLTHVAGDGRVYPGWRQIGAAAGRTSCKDPNMQQLPRDGGYKQCVRALAGRALIKADYSQIELRLACKIAREPKMWEAYTQGQDLHTLTAQLLLGKQDVTKADRQIAKSANFGLLYGMGAPGYRAYAKATYGLELTEDQAAKYREAFFAAYPRLKAWHWQVRNLHAKETRTLAGRRRLMFEGAFDTLRLNTPVQGSGADGLKRAMALLWERRNEYPDARPVLAVHDELVVECPVDQAELVKDWVIEAMEDGIRSYLDPVPVQVEAKVSFTWGG